MSRDREYFDYIRDMLESSQKAIEFAAGINYERFSKDDKTTYAVV